MCLLGRTVAEASHPLVRYCYNWKKSLYAQLFLTSSMLKKRSALFDDPLGQYLSDPNIDLKFHLPALQGALGLTADEIKRIIADAGRFVNPDNPMTLDTAKLTLTNVSILYRYGLLAKGLKRPCAILSHEGLSGLNPFALLHPDSLETLDEDKPFSQTLRFIEVANMVKESEFSVEDLDKYLCAIASTRQVSTVQMWQEPCCC